MNVSQKLELFQTLVKCGFKEIEVGFPSASNTEFTFNRRLIEENRAPGRRLAPGARAGARGLDRAHVRVAGRREARRSSTSTTPPRPPSAASSSACRRRKSSQVAVRGAQDDQGPLAAAQGHRSHAPVFARKLQRHGSRIRERGFRSGHGRLAADAGAEDDSESAGHGRSGDAERLCRPDRVDVPQHQESRFAHHQPAHAQRPLHRRGGHGTWACWPARIASKARSSATANAPAISISSPWRSISTCTASIRSWISRTSTRFARFTSVAPA